MSKCKVMVRLVHFISFMERPSYRRNAAIESETKGQWNKRLWYSLSSSEMSECIPHLIALRPILVQIETGNGNMESNNAPK